MPREQCRVPQAPPPETLILNDLSSAIRDHRRRRCPLSCDPIPSPLLCILIPLFLLGLAVSVFILVAVHNAILLVALLLLLALVLSFLLWNSYDAARDGAVRRFLAQFPLSDLRTARDGQLVKITGFVSCGNLSLESSYEKIPKCIYTSTLLYEFQGFQWKPCSENECFKWNLAYAERFVVDFYISDPKSGMRVLVKAGHCSKVTPLIDENPLVNTTSKNRILSSTLTKWLQERHLSAEGRLLCLEEGYANEGSSLTVFGRLRMDDGNLLIVHPSEPISTGCMVKKFLLPTDIDGLILSISDCLHAVVEPHYL